MSSSITRIARLRVCLRLCARTRQGWSSYVCSRTLLCLRHVTLVVSSSPSFPLDYCPNRRVTAVTYLIPACGHEHDRPLRVRVVDPPHIFGVSCHEAFETTASEAANEGRPRRILFLDVRPKWSWQAPMFVFSDPRHHVRDHLALRLESGIHGSGRTSLLAPRHIYNQRVCSQLHRDAAVEETMHVRTSIAGDPPERPPPLAALTPMTGERDERGRYILSKRAWREK